jgi:hypothetical protein
MNLDKAYALRAELKRINKIINYCKKWQKRIEHQLEDDIWTENAEEELEIINEMVGFCRSRLDEIKEEVNDI